jgi:hypothetical protein
VSVLNALDEHARCENVLRACVGESSLLLFNVSPEHAALVAMP